MATSIIKNHNQPVVISQTMSVNVSAGNTAVYTGLSVTVPARCIYAFRGILGYASAMPKETWVGVSNTNSPETYGYQNSAHNDGNSVSFCGYAPDAQTFYIWGKWANADSNSSVTVRGWYQEV